MTSTTKPNPNDQRADRALAALSAAGNGDSDVKDAAARLLADVRHLCRRHRITIGALTRRATTTYRREVEQHGPVACASSDADAIAPEPIDVIANTLRGPNHYRVSVGEICGEFLDEPDILIPLWDLLVEALVAGRTSEDPQDIPHRLFAVSPTQRPALARQLLELRDEVTAEGAIDPAQLGEPDGGLEQFLD